MHSAGTSCRTQWVSTSGGNAFPERHADRERLAANKHGSTPWRNAGSRAGQINDGLSSNLVAEREGIAQ